MSYKGVVFDLDDTIWDFNKNSSSAISYIHQDFCKRYNLEVSEDEFFKMYDKFNNMLWDEYQRGERTSQSISYTRFVMVANHFNVSIDEKEASVIANIYLDKLYSGKILMPYAYELLEYVADKYKVGLITNGFSKGLIRLENCDIEKFFDFVITSQMYGKPKPDIGIFQHVANNLKLNYDECIFIGDNYEVDIVGAKNAGFSTIFYNVHNYDLEKVDKAADYIVDSLEEIKEII